MNPYFTSNLLPRRRHGRWAAIRLWNRFCEKPYFWIDCRIFRYHPNISSNFKIKFHKKKFLEKIPEKNSWKNLWQKFLWKIRNCPLRTKFVSRKFLFFSNFFDRSKNELRDSFPKNRFCGLRFEQRPSASVRANSTSWNF